MNGESQSSSLVNWKSLLDAKIILAVLVGVAVGYWWFTRKKSRATVAMQQPRMPAYNPLRVPQMPAMRGMGNIDSNSGFENLSYLGELGVTRSNVPCDSCGSSSGPESLSDDFNIS